jgi:DNA-directed RNA polymerase specialized sigma24 family protein
VLALTAPTPHLIDEIAHEAFVFAFGHPHEYRRGTSFFAWLSSIARNLLRWKVLRHSREKTNRQRYLERRATAELPPDRRKSVSPRLDLLAKAYSLDSSWPHR